MKSALIVDDDPHIRSVFAQALQFQGFVVTTAENGKVALELLRSGLNPSVIFVDFIMPVMGGAEFLAQTKLDGRLNAIPVALLSATVDNAAASGADLILEKPITLDRFLMVAESLAQRVSRPRAETPLHACGII